MKIPHCFVRTSIVRTPIQKKLQMGVRYKPLYITPDRGLNSEKKQTKSRSRTAKRGPHHVIAVDYQIILPQKNNPAHTHNTSNTILQRYVYKSPFSYSTAPIPTHPHAHPSAALRKESRRYFFTSGKTLSRPLCCFGSLSQWSQCSRGHLGRSWVIST